MIPLIYFSDDSHPSCISHKERGIWTIPAAGGPQHYTVPWFCLAFGGFDSPLLFGCAAGREQEADSFLPSGSLSRSPASEMKHGQLQLP